MRKILASIQKYPAILYEISSKPFAYHWTLSIRVRCMQEQISSFGLSLNCISMTCARNQHIDNTLRKEDRVLWIDGVC